MAIFIEKLDEEEMRRSLRNKHRTIWLSFVIALPAILAIAWNVAPIAKKNIVSVSRADMSLPCVHPSQYIVETAMAIYDISNAKCGGELSVLLLKKIRVPQLAIYISLDSIQYADLQTLPPIAFFDGEEHLKFEIPKSVDGNAFFILLADNVKHQPLDQVKMFVK
jgi:hypothetical protein